MNNFVIADPRRCIGCRTCEIACVLAHSSDGSLAGLTRNNFIPRLKVVKTAQVSTPVQCHQCEDAPCIKVCAERAIVQSGKSVQVIPGRCVGCKNCLMACPYGAMEIVPAILSSISMNRVGRTDRVEPFKCDLCKDRVGGPACVEVCLTHALQEIDGQKLAKRMQRRRETAAQQALEINAPTATTNLWGGRLSNGL